MFMQTNFHYFLQLDKSSKLVQSNHCQLFSICNSVKFMTENEWATFTNYLRTEFYCGLYVVVSPISSNKPPQLKVCGYTASYPQTNVEQRLLIKRLLLQISNRINNSPVFKFTDQSFRKLKSILGQNE